jgi:ubiquinone/menaquinone biosynthesis C-methylase UbiE
VTRTEAEPISIRSFKESAWQSAAAAAKYLQTTEAASLSMDVEFDVLMRYARGRVLDVGAGTGRFSRGMADRGLVVVALDISPEMLKAGRCVGRSRYDCAVGSAFALPFADASFDTVASFWLFVHFDEWRSILAEMLRVARPGAQVVFEIQNALHFERAREICPDATFVDQVQTPAGFHAFATHEEVADAAVRGGATVEQAQYYGLFDDNFIAQAVLGNRYQAWIADLRTLLEDEYCRRFWLEVEMSGLPPLLGRKQLIVLRNGGAAAPGAPPESRGLVSVDCEPSAEIERSLALFREAFEPAGLTLPVLAPSV